MADSPGELADQLFHGAARATVPWSPRSRLKREPPYDADLISATLRGPQHLAPVDPDGLRASQPYVTRAGVVYYLSDSYELTGETYADHLDRSNRFPLIWLAPNGQRVILTGHHRSAAALLRGSPVWARVVPGQAGTMHRSVTAALHVGKVSPAGSAIDAASAVAIIRSGHPVTVADDSAAMTVLDLLGTSSADAARALRFSHTGDLHAEDTQLPASS